MKKYKYIQVGIASPEEIRSWAYRKEDGFYGEVKKHETINYRTLKPNVMVFSVKLSLVQRKIINVLVANPANQVPIPKYAKNAMLKLPKAKCAAKKWASLLWLHRLSIFGIAMFRAGLPHSLT